MLGFHSFAQEKEEVESLLSQQFHARKKSVAPTRLYLDPGAQQRFSWNGFAQLRAGSLVCRRVEIQAKTRLLRDVKDRELEIQAPKCRMLQTLHALLSTSDVCRDSVTRP